VCGDHRQTTTIQANERSRFMKSVVQIERQGKRTDVRASAAAAGLPTEEIETKVALIQALIPLGLQAVGEALDAEVTALAGIRYCRRGGQSGVDRWGQQRGSVYLADQKLPIPVPRVRDRAANREVALTTYERLQVPRAADAGLFRKMLVGLTCRQYKACAEAVPEAFGLSASSVSRRFIRASARHLQTFCERRLDGDEFVALVLDGKTFAQDAMVIALGITVQGEKKSWASSRRPPRTSRSVRRSCERWWSPAFSASSTEPRGCARRSRPCSETGRWCSVASGTSGRT
jgi:hypothetical protein